jgi:magnesium chelatase family protein
MPSGKFASFASNGHETGSRLPAGNTNYPTRISGPLLDRIDIHIEAPALSIRELPNDKPGERSAVIRSRIQAARERQPARFAGTKLTANARMSHARVRAHVPLDTALGEMLQHAMERLSLSARAYVHGFSPLVIRTLASGV